MGGIIPSIEQLRVSGGRKVILSVADNVRAIEITEKSGPTRKGVSKEAHDKGYRVQNLFNNYGTGKVYRVNPASIIGRNYSRYGYEYTLPYRAIGELVHLDDEVGNSKMNFTTEFDFTFINDAIRQYSLDRNISNRYGDEYTKPTDYLFFGSRGEYDSSRVPRIGDVGEEYILPETSNAFIFNDRKMMLNRYGYDGDNGYFAKVVAPYKETYNGIFHDFMDPYGISEKKEAVDYYSVGESHEVNSKLKDQGIGMTYSLPKDSFGATYTYFEEPGYRNKFDDSKDTQFGVNFNLESSESLSPLLEKTKKLFADKKIGSLINRFKTDLDNINEELDIWDSTYGMSRGRNLKKKSASIDGYDDPYCRVWTSFHQYHRLNDLIRPFGDKDGFKKMLNGKDLRPNNGFEKLEKNGVMMPNGRPRIAPHKKGGVFDGDVTRYMFSIENLAWKDVSGGNKLSPEQKGKNGGRIMWFPPYNLKFTENVTVDWNANKFIGRGEQIYTYTNTDRSGTLSFTILIDHPSVINKWSSGRQSDEEKMEYEQELLRFFAGCEPLNMEPKINPLRNGEQNTKTESIGQSVDPSIIQKPFKKVAYIVFFPNNFTTQDHKDINEGYEILSKYETSNGVDFTETDGFTHDEIINGIDDGVNVSRLNLNESPSADVEKIIRKTLFGGDDDIEIRYLYNPTNGISNLMNEITENSIFGEPINGIDNDGTCIMTDMTIMGCASSHGHAEKNVTLGLKRGNFIKNVSKRFCQMLKNYKIDDFPINRRTIEVHETTNEGENGGKTRINSTEAKIARCAYIMFEMSHTAAKDVRVASDEGGAVVQGLHIRGANNNNTGSKPTEKITKVEVRDDYFYDNEYLYFSMLSETSPAVYKNIVDKIKYFDPAFHSITPEGFNSRLTFLHQCTRQGPTHSLSSGEITSDSNSYNKWAGNLAFGRAPYCILRIGDFFNTKICITSLSIDYDNGGGVQWDLNPEGVGVQPMFANVNINFNFLGGQDIKGPIDRLQNAVTYNYYANASVYDRHADYDGHMFDAISGKHRTQTEINKELEEYYKSKENIDNAEVEEDDETNENTDSVYVPITQEIKGSSHIVNGLGYNGVPMTMRERVLNNGLF